MEITEYIQAPVGERYTLPIGLTRNVPAHLYHKDPGSVSKSTLYEMRLSAAHCKQRMDEPVEASKGMTFGTIVDFMVYTPDETPPFVIAPPEFTDFRLKEPKAWAAAQTLPYVTSADFDRASACVDALHENDNFAESFAAGVGQLSMKAQLPCVTLKDLCLRGRPDWVPLNKPYLVDLKTTGYGMAAEHVFAKTASDFGYYIQAALYLDMWNFLNPDDHRWAFKFHVIERDPPFGSNTIYYEIGTETMIYGRRDYQTFLDRYERCVLHGIWPGYPTKSIAGSLPGWKLKQLRDAA